MTDRENENKLPLKSRAQVNAFSCVSPGLTAAATAPVMSLLSPAPSRLCDKIAGAVNLNKSILLA